MTRLAAPPDHPVPASTAQAAVDPTGYATCKGCGARFDLNPATGPCRVVAPPGLRRGSGQGLRRRAFDPGEANASSYLRFLSPDGGTCQYARFSWTSNDGRSGTNVTEIQTSTGTPLFNNRILTITFDMPTTYGSGGLDPNGLGEDGWWLVEYDVRAGNDTTTWEVEIRGNPVHLKVP